LNVRILFINADRTSLAAFLLATTAAAFVTGLLWGGKTWCNYICPVGLVQRIYTEPQGGLLESQANTAGTSLTQSTCRTPTPEGDRSICVGCTVYCPDADIEKSYWETLSTNPRLPYVYYGFFGLICGFYSWYYFYAGNWDYYFSGAWTHDPNQLGKLLQPGIMFAEHIIAIPVIASTPLILGGAVGIAMVVGKICESLYRRVASAALSTAEVTNHCLTFTAYSAINVFYSFGGRPNLMLLPTPALHVVDFLIVALSTLWFWRAIDRSPARYRREGLAVKMVDQLRTPVDIGRYLEGRRIDELSPDEIYTLAKTLPGFSRDQRMRAYRNMLREAQTIDPDARLEFLRAVRTQIGISDAEHAAIEQELARITNNV
jgi:Pyruvate/2-oxoacid:ferredoxin oxidoreductase delta subunit